MYIFWKKFLFGTVILIKLCEAVEKKKALRKLLTWILCIDVFAYFHIITWNSVLEKKKQYDMNVINFVLS